MYLIGNFIVTYFGSFVPFNLSLSPRKKQDNPTRQLITDLAPNVAVTSTSAWTGCP